MKSTNRSSTGAPSHAIARIAELDRAAARASALRRMRVENTSDAYLALYRDLIARAARPVARAAAAR